MQAFLHFFVEKNAFFSIEVHYVKDRIYTKKREFTCLHAS